MRQAVVMMLCAVLAFQFLSWQPGPKYPKGAPRPHLIDRADPADRDPENRPGPHWRNLRRGWN